MISPASGNRSLSYLENTIASSTKISKTPLLPSINSVSSWNEFLISAARLEALGRYFQRPQYLIETFIALLILQGPVTLR